MDINRNLLVAQSMKCPIQKSNIQNLVAILVERFGFFCSRNRKFFPPEITGKFPLKPENPVKIRNSGFFRLFPIFSGFFFAWGGVY